MRILIAMVLAMLMPVSGQVDEESGSFWIHFVRAKGVPEGKRAIEGVWTEGITLWNSVQSYGETVSSGDLKRIRLYRNGQVYTYNMEIDKHKGVKIYPKDLIEVPRKVKIPEKKEEVVEGPSSVWITVGNKAEAEPKRSWKEQATLYSFVAAHGGKETYDDLTNIKLSRNGNIYTYNLLLDEHKGVKLYPGDLVRISSKGAGVKVDEKVRNGDLLEIRVAGVPVSEQGRLNSTYKVDDGGMIKMWKIGKIQTKGKSHSVLAKEIADAYVKAGIYKAPVFVVLDGEEVIDESWIICGSSSAWVSALDEAKAENRSWISVTLARFVKAHFGAKTYDDLKQVKLARNGQVYTYNLMLNKHKRVSIYPKDRIQILPKR